MNDVPFDTWASSFARAVSLASRFELELRVFAEELPQTRGKAFEKLEAVSLALCTAFPAAFGAQEKRALDAARKLRNKLTHCEFWTAERIIEEHSGPLPTTGSVCTYDPLIGVRTNRDMDRSDARIYGWLMEATGTGGMFERAEVIFGEAIRILRKARLIVATSGP